MISVVILTHNEADNLPRCLASVDWSDDVLVIDSGSSDGTQDLAQKLGARVMHRPFDDFAAQRNFALDHGQLVYNWVLHLDADEVVSAELAREMKAITTQSTDSSRFAGYCVPSRLIFMGRWLRHSGQYPAYQVRFGTRDGLRFRMVGHGQREDLPPQAVGTLTGHLVHYNFSKGISNWLAKHARYARDEAISALQSQEPVSLAALWRAGDATQRRRALKALSHQLPARPLLRFLYIYLGRRGFLDGRAGLRYALLLAVYQWMIDLNMTEMQQSSGGTR